MDTRLPRLIGSTSARYCYLVGPFTEDFLTAPAHGAFCCNGDADYPVPPFFFDLPSPDPLPLPLGVSPPFFGVALGV